MLQMVDVYSHGKWNAETAMPRVDHLCSQSLLSCGLHLCPSRCHQIVDHSKMKCETIVHVACSKKHKLRRLCYQTQLPCPKCEREARAQELKRQRDYQLERTREANQKKYEQELADIKDQTEHQRQVLRNKAEEEARQTHLKQARKDLADMKRRAEQHPQSFVSVIPSDSKPQSNDSVDESVSEASKRTPSVDVDGRVISPNQRKDESNSPDRRTEAENSRSSGFATSPSAAWKLAKSESKEEWEHSKTVECASNQALDSLMDMVGLEEIKAAALALKTKVDTLVRQGASLKNERFNAAFLGNPGTGEFLEPSAEVAYSFRENHCCATLGRVPEIRRSPTG